jgi:hypothetical protein
MKGGGHLTVSKYNSHDPCYGMTISVQWWRKMKQRPGPPQTRITTHFSDGFTKAIPLRGRQERCVGGGGRESKRKSTKGERGERAERKGSGHQERARRGSREEWVEEVDTNQGGWGQGAQLGWRQGCAPVYSLVPIPKMGHENLVPERSQGSMPTPPLPRGHSPH